MEQRRPKLYICGGVVRRCIEAIQTYRYFRKTHLPKKPPDISEGGFSCTTVTQSVFLNLVS